MRGRVEDVSHDVRYFHVAYLLQFIVKEKDNRTKLTSERFVLLIMTDEECPSSCARYCDAEIPVVLSCPILTIAQTTLHFHHTLPLHSLRISLKNPATHPF